MAAAGHERGCTKDEVRPSSLVSGYAYCPGCQRMIEDPTVIVDPTTPPTLDDILEDATAADDADASDEDEAAA